MQISIDILHICIFCRQCENLPFFIFLNLYLSAENLFLGDIFTSLFRFSLFYVHSSLYIFTINYRIRSERSKCAGLTDSYKSRFIVPGKPVHLIGCILFIKMIPQFFRQRCRSRILGIPAWIHASLQTVKNQLCGTAQCQSLPSVILTGIHLYLNPLLIYGIGGTAPAARICRSMAATPSPASCNPHNP